MRRLGCLLIAAAVLSGLAAASASAKLTPAEQKWVSPLIHNWNVQNAGLQVVIQQAAAKNALIAGEKPQNEALSKTLIALVSCETPKNVVKDAGAPPTTRLKPFSTALGAACADDFYGANYFAKAIGAVQKGNETAAGTDLKDGVAKFKAGSAEIKAAYDVLIEYGGKSIFAD